MVHPGNKTYTTGKSLAVNPLDFEFIGKSAHASAAPEKGINALDGVILLFNGINALRQHVTSDVRIHGIITHGGDAPNIIPEYAKARFFIRADTKIKCGKVTQRIKDIANGAALATGTKVNIVEFQNSVDNILPNKKFDNVFKEIWESFGLDIHSPENKVSGSSDVGNISHVVPTIQPSVKIGPDNLVGHTIEFREAARSKDGDRALLLGAKTLALTGLKLILNKKLLKEIKDEFEYQLKNEANEF
jgi:metal-dependent amidase/aminoacylase/carboxypeptidase family protein